MAQLKQNAILLEKLDGRLVITLNRPKVRNALSFELQNELQHALIDADNDAEVHCVIIKGAGKDFCAGYDLQDRTMMKSDEYKIYEKGMDYQTPELVVKNGIKITWIF